MVSQDYGYLIMQLERKVATLEKQISQRKDFEAIKNLDWDNSTLMQEWSISKRTAANYRKQGLEYFKRGGRVYYSFESRERFAKHRKQIIKQLNISNI